MSTTADENAAQAAGLQDFLSYPFAECIQDRRTRRVSDSDIRLDADRIEQAAHIRGHTRQ